MSGPGFFFVASVSVNRHPYLHLSGVSFGQCVHLYILFSIMVPICDIILFIFCVCIVTFFLYLHLSPTLSITISISPHLHLFIAASSTISVCLPASTSSIFSFHPTHLLPHRFFPLPLSVFKLLSSLFVSSLCLVSRLAQIPFFVNVKVHGDVKL